MGSYKEKLQNYDMLLYDEKFKLFVDTFNCCWLTDMSNFCGWIVSPFHTSAARSLDEGEQGGLLPVGKTMIMAKI